MKPYDAAARAFFRNPIPQLAMVAAAILKLQGDVPEIAPNQAPRMISFVFKRNQYARRGWCYFEKQVSQMGTPATGVLDLEILWKMMKKKGCEGDLEQFVQKYPEMGAKSTPQNWPDFVQARGEYGIAVNLVSSRDTMPMGPGPFNRELDSLVFTNNSDHGIVSKIYKRVFEDLFQSTNVETMDFSGLCWTFHIKELADTTLQLCGKYLKVLRLNDNFELKGDLSDFLPLLPNLSELDISNNRLMTGDLSNTAFPVSMTSFKASKCSELRGHDKLRAALPQCNIRI
jgi:hypothetical protein